MRVESSKLAYRGKCYLEPLHGQATLSFTFEASLGEDERTWLVFSLSTPLPQTIWHAVLR